MAKFSFNGFDEISASFEEISKLTDDELYSVIQPAAEMLKEFFVMTIRGKFQQHTGALAEGVQIERKTKNGTVRAWVGLKGSHPGSSRGKRKRNAQGGGGGHYSGSNAEVGFIQEHGSQRITPRYWMQSTNEDENTSAAIIGAMQEAWDALLASKGL